MHFVIKFKIPWILKWNYVKEGDIIDCHWFVKWWDKFPHTDAIIQIVYKDFAKKTPKKSTPPAIPVAAPRTIVTELVTPSHSFVLQKKRRLLMISYQMKSLLLPHPLCQKTRRRKKALPRMI